MKPAALKGGQEHIISSPKLQLDRHPPHLLLSLELVSLVLLSLPPRLQDLLHFRSLPPLYLHQHELFTLLSPSPLLLSSTQMLRKISGKKLLLSLPLSSLLWKRRFKLTPSLLPSIQLAFLTLRPLFRFSRLQPDLHSHPEVAASFYPRRFHPNPGRPLATGGR